MLETFFRDFGPYWHDSITQLLQICRLHIHELNLTFHPKGALLDWELVTMETIWVKWTHFHVQETSLRWFELCDMVHYPAGSSHQKMVHCSHKGMDMVSNNTQVSCGFKQCSIGTKGPKVCQENIPRTITPPPAWTVETRQDGSMLSCSLHQILTLPSECCSRNRDSSDQATFFQSSIIQFWWACANFGLCFLFLADRSGTRCGLLLLEPICFRVRRVVRSEMVFGTPWL